MKRKHHLAPIPGDANSSDQPKRKRRISHSAGTSTREDHHSPGSTLHASEAKEYIEHELQCNPALSQDRRSALEAARNFVNQLSNPGLRRQDASAVERVDIEEGLKSPVLTPELLYMMLPGEYVPVSMTHTF